MKQTICTMRAWLLTVCVLGGVCHKHDPLPESR